MIERYNFSGPDFLKAYFERPMLEWMYTQSLPQSVKYFQWERVVAVWWLNYVFDINIWPIAHDIVISLCVVYLCDITNHYLQNFGGYTPNRSRFLNFTDSWQWNREVRIFNKSIEILISVRQWAKCKRKWLRHMYLPSKVTIVIWVKQICTQLMHILLDIIPIGSCILQKIA